MDEQAPDSPPDTVGEEPEGEVVANTSESFAASALAGVAAAEYAVPAAPVAVVTGKGTSSPQDTAGEDSQGKDLARAAESFKTVPSEEAAAAPSAATAAPVVVTTGNGSSSVANYGLEEEPGISRETAEAVCSSAGSPAVDFPFLKGVESVKAPVHVPGLSVVEGTDDQAPDFPHDAAGEKPQGEVVASTIEPFRALALAESAADDSAAPAAPVAVLTDDAAYVLGFAEHQEEHPPARRVLVQGPAPRSTCVWWGGQFIGVTTVVTGVAALAMLSLARGKKTLPSKLNHSCSCVSDIISAEQTSSQLCSLLYRQTLLILLDV